MYSKLKPLCSLRVLLVNNVQVNYNCNRYFNVSSKIWQISKPSLITKSTSSNKKIGPFGWFLLLIPATTFGLGTWQVQRKQWKENLIRDLKERSNTTPVKLPQDYDKINDLEYYPVHIHGRFLHDKEMFMGPRSLLIKGDASTDSALISKGQNTSQGFWVITPFKLSDRDQTILVNRGWIPKSNKDPKKRIQGQIETEVDLVGVIRLHEERPNFMPKNNPDSNNWFYRNLNEMSKKANTDPIYLDATTDFDIPGGPVGGQTRISLRNEHMSYIFTWYSLCAFTSFMWYRQFILKLTPI